jgi:hypothetical protein
MSLTGDPALLAAPAPPSPADLPGPLAAGACLPPQTWSVVAANGVSGTLIFRVRVSADDANEPRSMLQTVTATTSISEAQQLASDPFGDGTSFSYLFTYGGKLHLGPGRDGGSVIRSDPDGGNPQPVRTAFFRDANVNPHWTADPALGPYAWYGTLGMPGCTWWADQSGCGPDLENGRGLFTTGRFDDGGEWVIAAGASDRGGVTHVYLGQDVGGWGMGFTYLDLASYLSTFKNLSASLVYNNKLYLGFPHDTAQPRGFALPAPATPRTFPGRDLSVASGDALDLQLSTTRLHVPGVTRVDAMAEFAGKLYMFNEAGCIRWLSDTPAPGPQGFAWQDCTPSAWGSSSIADTRYGNLEPSDRAVPQAVTWKGLLYVARNTTGGPQLWRCDPAVGGNPVQCDPGDWQVVSPEGAGSLTRFGDPGNTAISFLAASARYLYLGFNHAGGARVFRASAAQPSRADFLGRAADVGGGVWQPCSAAAGSCEGLGGNGLGAGATRIFDGKVFTFGGAEYVYLAAGDGAGPVRVFRVAE